MTDNSQPTDPTFRASAEPSPIRIVPRPAPFYQQQEITLYHANCCDVLPYLRDVDGVVTDPPWHLHKYIDDLKKADGVSHQHEIDYYAKMWLFYGSWLTLVQQTGARWGWYFIGIDEAPAFLRMAWLLGMPVQHAWPCEQYEWLFYIGETPLQNSEEPFVRGALQKHGTPKIKPEPLISALLVASASVDQTILDPFCGEGSTLLAAPGMGNTAIGVEARLERCEVAKAALLAAQKALLA